MVNSILKDMLVQLEKKDFTNWDYGSLNFGRLLNFGHPPISIF